jgi:bifunctional enzyme CysN/CysC
MLGIRHVAVAVNKMDLVGWSQSIFNPIELNYRRFAQDLGFQTITAIPLSALEGHNVVERHSAEMPWFKGASLLARETNQAFAMPVQWVNRPNHEFRGFSGRIGTGSVSPGDRVRISPSGVESRVKEIIVGKASAIQGSAGQSVTLVLEDEVDASRGDVIAAASHPVESADQFEADLIWMSEHPLLRGRP